MAIHVKITRSSFHAGSLFVKYMVSGDRTGAGEVTLDAFVHETSDPGEIERALQERIKQYVMDDIRREQRDRIWLTFSNRLNETEPEFEIPA